MFGEVDGVLVREFCLTQESLSFFVVDGGSELAAYASPWALHLGGK